VEGRRPEAVVIFDSQPDAGPLKLGHHRPECVHYLIWGGVMSLGVRDHPHDVGADLPRQVQVAAEMGGADAARPHLEGDVQLPGPFDQGGAFRAAEPIQRQVVGDLHHADAQAHGPFQ
jgi:hypothetical protein